MSAVCRLWCRGGESASGAVCHAWFTGFVASIEQEHIPGRRWLCRVSTTCAAHVTMSDSMISSDSSSPSTTQVAAMCTVGKAMRDVSTSSAWLLVKPAGACFVNIIAAFAAEAVLNADSSGHWWCVQWWPLGRPQPLLSVSAGQSLHAAEAVLKCVAAASLLNLR